MAGVRCPQGIPREGTRARPYSRVANRKKPYGYAYQDERFNYDIDVLTGYKTRTVVCMPIKHTNGDVLGVAQVIDKFGDIPFTQSFLVTCSFAA